jgi:exosortase
MRRQALVTHGAFLCACVLIAVVCRQGLHEWLEASKISQQSSDFWTIPVISVFLCYERRAVVFSKAHLAALGLSGLAGLALLGLGIGIYVASINTRFASGGGAMLGVIVGVSGAFLACYGKEAWRAARFPLGFLLFAIPLPQAILDPLIRWLQYGSAAVVNLLFVLLRVPYVRDGLTFDLSALSIEIAPECSGIRSSFALMVLTVVLSYIALHSTWRRLLLLAAVIPLVLIKNGIRIVTLCLLSIHVDPSFIDGSLHRRGGFVFFGIVLAAEGTLCWLLRRSELRAQSDKVEADAAIAPSNMTVGVAREHS